MIISVINTTQLKKEEVQKKLRAINRQLAEDFKRYWHRDIELRLEGWTGKTPDPKKPINMRGDAVLYLWDQVDVDDAIGYHDLTGVGVPFGFVFTELAAELGEDWSVTLSHEVLEMAMDPEANLLAEGPHPDPKEDGRTVFHWYELCDAVQGSKYEIDGVEVANFLLPLYFTEGDEHRNHNDFLGTGLGSFQVGPGGYAGFLDPETGEHDTWIRPRDNKATHRLVVKQQHKGVMRADRHKGRERDAAIVDKNTVHCEAVIFELDDTVALPERLHTAQQLARTVLGDGWELQRSPGDPNEYDALYRGSTAIGFAQAWQLAHELAEDDAVVYAEPSLSFPVAGEFEQAHDGPARALRASSRGSSSHKAGTEIPAWGLELCRVPKAWQRIEAEHKRPGAGVRVGHPDSGYRPHDEMDATRVMTQIDFDFLGGDSETISNKGNHGLATASVIMSGTGGVDDRIKGPALHAEIVPLRVTKPGWIRPAPVLIGGGMRRLRDAIDHAVKVHCKVISMSLGGLPSRSVKKAIRRATDSGVIVLAAAGNQVRTVVWPARYDDVIAVAGCDIDRAPWSGSSHGGSVDITAPAESVWRACYNKKGKPDEARSDGTSYAVALTAGVAAMWLAYHGADVLAAKYGREGVHELFASLLKATANKNHNLPAGEFGAGIVDAEALMKMPLPKRRPAARKASAVPDADTPQRAVRALGLDRRIGVRAANLSDGLAHELLSADLLDGLTAPSATRGKKKKKAGARTRARGVSPQLRAVIDR
ncbi:MAG: S8/S53 family peptidase [Candidatus Latescibacteria bacterium]|jgi:hypothetical protein|nr:S8/S53 family peptidase [Candidatus Latescibacterota bacterium]